MGSRRISENQEGKRGLENRRDTLISDRRAEVGKVVPKEVVRTQVPNKIRPRTGETRKLEGKDQLINSDL